jgi:hypothetical protein
MAFGAMGAAGMSGMGSSMMSGISGMMQARNQITNNNIQAQNAINQHTASKELARMRERIAQTKQNQKKAEAEIAGDDFEAQASAKIGASIARRSDTGRGGSGIEAGTGTTRDVLTTLMRKAALGRGRIAYDELTVRNSLQTEEDLEDWRARVEDVNIANVISARDANNSNIKKGAIMNLVGSLMGGLTKMTSSIAGGQSGWFDTGGVTGSVGSTPASFTAPSFSTGTYGWSAPDFGSVSTPSWSFSSPPNSWAVTSNFGNTGASNYYSGFGQQSFTQFNLGGSRGW